MDIIYLSHNFLFHFDDLIIVPDADFADQYRFFITYRF